METRTLTRITMENLLSRFDESVHDSLQEMAERDGVTHLVLFENQDLWSSQLGEKTAMAVGPGCTYGTPDEVSGRHLHDLPSMRQYPVAVVDLGKEQR
jgi:hypothetical protein